MIREVKPLPTFKPIECIENSGCGYIPTVFNKGMDIYQALCYLEYYVLCTYKSMNELIADWNALQKWIDTELEGYAKEQLTIWLEDGTLFNMFKPYVDKMIVDKKDKITEYKEIKNNAYVVNDVIDCALSYYYNNDKLFYGNQTALNDTIASDGTKLAIDCSTLVCLVLNGVKYETSRYTLGGTKYNNISDYEYATNIYDNGSSQFRRYANMIGEYFYNMGMAYYHNDNFTNLRAGDLMFWKGEHTEGSFMDITHVGIFLNLTSDEKVRYIDANTGRENVVSLSSNLIDDTFRETIVLCARPDYNATNYIIGQNIVNGLQKHTITNVAGIKYDTLSPLQRGFYTVLIKGNGDAPSVSSNNMSLKTYYLGNNLYIAYLRLENISNNTLTIYVSNNTKTFNLEWVTMYRRFIESPYPFYVAPTIKGNRGKVRLDSNKLIPANPTQYVLIHMDSIVGNNISGVYHLSNDGCITVDEAGQYIVNVGISTDTFNSFANYRLVTFEQEGTTPTLLSNNNIIGVDNHSVYSRMTIGCSLKAGQRIGLQINNTTDINLLSNSFNTYIEVIKI